MVFTRQYLLFWPGETKEPFIFVSPRADLFHQLLAATKRRRKITKPPSLGRAPFNQVSNFGRAPFNQVSNFGRAPFNQEGNMSAPLLVSKTKNSIISTLQLKVPPPPHMAWGFLLLPAPTADPHPSSYQGQRNPHTPPSLLSMVSSDAASWPQYGHPEISQTFRLKSGS
jgi:hypothetical protein